MNMSGAYDLEPLMVGQDFDLVDCRDICGKELICSDEAQKELSRRKPVCLTKKQMRRFLKKSNGTETTEIIYNIVNI